MQPNAQNLLKTREKLRLTNSDACFCRNPDGEKISISPLFFFNDRIVCCQANDEHFKFLFVDTALIGKEPRKCPAETSNRKPSNATPR